MIILVVREKLDLVNIRERGFSLRVSGGSALVRRKFLHATHLRVCWLTNSRVLRSLLVRTHWSAHDFEHYDTQTRRVQLFGSHGFAF
jgi:hypothetical protein